MCDCYQIEETDVEIGIKFDEYLLWFVNRLSTSNNNWVKIKSFFQQNFKWDNSVVPNIEIYPNRDTHIILSKANAE